ncbi:MAG: arsenosugar biosynthesis radical SAM protein ArsS [Cyclobacteriaceae bacterium]|nr:arsenosugar biosynthesis radical SAM protein ArsS [Cyclobacteriaceae bacterium]
MTKSLHAQLHDLSSPEKQIHILENGIFSTGQLPTFSDKIKGYNTPALKPSTLEIFQMNVGYMCNQTCKHCHVDAGPDRKEIMSRETMEQCMKIVENHRIPTIDITGGAPEMNPEFRWLVERATQAEVKEIIVRSNLTIITSNPKYNDLPVFFAKNRVRVVSSLPFYNAGKTDRQRGEGVFDKSIKALQLLNKEGYGVEGTGLILDLVYNPAGAFLPGNQSELERDFKKELKEQFDITFSNLLTITNLPISRFLEFLIRSENYEDYMESLVMAFNPATLDGVMCKNTISVGWDGYLFDCDFNQMLDLKVNEPKTNHVNNFNLDTLQNRKIVINQHCYGCTAGAGSSCQGTVA